MLQNAAIDVAIGLILMYLMLSLLCTVINEFIATKLSLRARSLAAALEKLLDDPGLYDRFYKHGLIVGSKRATATGTQSTTQAVFAAGSAAVEGVKEGVQRVRQMVGGAAPAAGSVAAGAKEDHPSYLSGRTVALALIGSLDPSKPIPTMQEIEDAAKKLQGTKIGDALLSSLTEAQKDIDKVRTSIATWFDDSMERLSGAYKRQLKWISMIIGLIVAVAFNADSFKVATTLWSDPARRASVAEVAKEITTRALPETGQPVNEAKLKQAIEDTNKTLPALPIGWSCDPVQDGNAASTTKKAADSKDIKGAPQAFKECVTNNFERMTAKPTDGLVQILGWLLTAAALSLGAPFWFDLLGKFVNLRGAGNKPQRADAKP
jgi:hypothetical protein